MLDRPEDTESYDIAIRPLLDFRFDNGDRRNDLSNCAMCPNMKEK